MKAKLLMIALALFAGQAQAGWEYLATGKNSDDSNYIDRGTIHKQGAYTLAWELIDYSTPQKNSIGDVYSSVKVLNVAKCGEFVLGTKTFVEYSGNMGGGAVVYSSRSKEFHEITWDYVLPGTTGDAMYKAMCGIE